MKNIALAVIVIPLAFGCGRLSGTNPVNPDFARTYETVANQHLADQNPQPDEAIKALEELRKKEPGNAMTSYLLALAYAKKNDWSSASHEIEAGNKAQSCIHYAQGDGVF